MEQNYPGLGQSSSTSQSRKLVFIRFLAPLLFFTVIISSPSPLPFVLNLIQFFSTSIDKNYMFLLCNSILVLIVKNSGLMGSSHQGSSNVSGESTTINGGRTQKVSELSEKKAAEAGEEKLVMEINKVQETPLVPLITLDPDGEEVEENVIVDDQDEEEPIELLSADELNKKCDDFIRKMREEIGFGAQEVIMV
ncbi:hypothetical protein Tsubulata_017087 [Turnera subulata]|uniref:DUF4408 domain-containing protein n=1 Tax=Turnera subulata TaxID=218843 RepID=A0A9Q0JNH3_9ROSI|nr:hypothetical protein Tsubulata_017087 [Turnera subulata]